MKILRNWPLYYAKALTAATLPTARVMFASCWIACGHRHDRSVYEKGLRAGGELGGFSKVLSLES